MRSQTSDLIDACGLWLVACDALSSCSTLAAPTLTHSVPPLQGGIVTGWTLCYFVSFPLLATLLPHCQKA